MVAGRQAGRLLAIPAGRRPARGRGDRGPGLVFADGAALRHRRARPPTRIDSSHRRRSRQPHARRHGLDLSRHVQRPPPRVLLRRQPARRAGGRRADGRRLQPGLDVWRNDRPQPGLPVRFKGPRDRRRLSGRGAHSLQEPALPGNGHPEVGPEHPAKGPAHRLRGHVDRRAAGQLELSHAERRHRRSPRSPARRRHRGTALHHDRQQRKPRRRTAPSRARSWPSSRA